VTLAQRIGWSALIAWYMWLIFGPVVVDVAKKVTVKIEQGRTHVTKTGQSGFALDGRNLGLAGSGQASGKALAFATRLYSAISDCWTLTKPEVNFLIALATFTGFYVGHAHQPGHFPFSLLACTLVGTLLVASGTGTLNQYIERSFDAKMRRTARRPLASGHMSASVGLALGIVLAALGSVFLAVRVNLLASTLALLTLFSYLLIYTPLKRKSATCTLVGAIPGAMPPLIGWAGASGHLSSEAWYLYGILFLWQFPHFMAIAWMYRDDYQRAGYRVLPVADRQCAFVNWMTVLPLLALILLSLFPAFFGHPDVIYALGALFVGSIFLYHGSVLALHKSNQHARRLLIASIAYLPVVFALLITRSVVEPH
jgi:protoheme IX farnesyltransferase